MRELHAVLERVRPELDAAVEAAALEVPAFAQLMRTLDPAVRAQQAEQSRARERAALLDGDWASYRESLRAQGTVYAHMGIEFGDWWALLRPYRDVVHAAVLPAELESERAALSGMGLFIDRAMASIADAYIETKQELVRKAEAQLGLHVQLFQSAPLGMLIYRWGSPPDPSSFRLVTANPAATAMSGGRLVVRSDEAEQVAVLDAEIAARYVLAIETREAQVWTSRTRAEDSGAETIYHCRCFALGGAFVGVVFEDVTERRRLQDALARHAAELERSNRELDEFAYVASHDLKAPLRDIDTLASWIAEDAADALPDGSRRHLATLQDRIGRMERLLEDLLQYSRAGRVRHDPQELDVRALVEDAVALAALPAGFEVSLAGEVSVACAPRVPLELVLRNLISNAVKHHDRAEGRVDVTWRSAGDFLEIAVTDDGPGIPPEFHERVFAMFQTLRPRDEVEGSGMGLAVVKKVVEAHGGRVTLDSAPGRGSTFRVVWPTDARRT